MPRAVAACARKGSWDAPPPYSGFSWRSSTYRDTNGVHSALTEARRMFKSPQRLVGIGLHNLRSIALGASSAQSSYGAPQRERPHATQYRSCPCLPELSVAAAQARVASRAAKLLAGERKTIAPGTPTSPTPCARGHAARAPPVYPSCAAPAAARPHTYLPRVCRRVLCAPTVLIGHALRDGVGSARTRTHELEACSKLKFRPHQRQGERGRLASRRWRTKRKARRRGRTSKSCCDAAR